MEQTATDLIITEFKQRDAVDLDERLPHWARRSNPVVRRHLGIYWKVLPPELDALARIFLAQVGLVALTLPVPFILEIVMPMIAVSVFLLPIALGGYAHLLFMVTVGATITVGNEMRNNTLDVLLVTPISLRHILMSKIAASVWRQMENLTILLFAVALLSLPLIVMQYAAMFPPDDYPILSRVVFLLALGVSLLRLLAEPIMVGAIGAMAGAVVPGRTPAIVSALSLSLFYFLLLNMPRLIGLSPATRVIVEFALPLALPVIITLFALRVAERFMTAD